MAQEQNAEIDFRQSNHEGHLIDWLHEAQAEGAKAVILNPGGFTHTSVALYDAIKSIATPVIEVHLSNPHQREEFRHTSYVGQASKGTIAGFGALSYELALNAALKLYRLPCCALSSERIGAWATRSEEHTSELQSLMRISYAVFCLKKKKPQRKPPSTSSS